MASRIWSEMGSRFRTKFILVSTVSVLIGLLLSGAVALFSTIRLGKDASLKIEEGLTAANREYLRNYIEMTAQRTNLLIDHALSDTTTLTQITQVLIDHESEFSDLNDTVAGVPFFKDNLVYDKRLVDAKKDTKGWYQNTKDEPCVVSVFGHCLNEDETIKDDVRQHIKMTTLLDAILPATYSNGAPKQWMYVLGPDGASYIRAAPWSDMASDFERLYPGQNKTDFWTFYFKGMVERWKGWVAHPETRKDLDGEITVTSPYDDAAGSGLIISVFHPLWSKDHKEFKGAAAMDFNLRHIIDFIKDVRLAKTGFAFVSSSQGNVIGISDAGEAVLGLRSSQSGETEGTRFLNRTLQGSNIPLIASLKLPPDDQVHFHDVDVAGDPHAGYIVVTRRLRLLNYFKDSIITPEHWNLGFVVPKKEVYAPLYAAQNDLNKTTQVILYGQIAIALATLLLVFMGVVGVSRSMTSGLIALSAGATEIQKKNYDVSVEVESGDEIGKLGAAFNVMAKEIREYTQNLEGLVQARTMDLAKANEKIMALNEALKEENIRLGAELDVAKQLQSMVLPKKNELEGIEDLEIAGYMEPADEVGGDYYDVLRQNGLVKIGIGDVTGHGLESGVVMLMVQTAVRTLLAAHENDPIRFYNVINEVLYQNIQRINSNRNMTLMLLDYRDDVCRITGQHEEVIIVRNTGELERVDTTPLGLPLGLDPNIEGFATCVDLKLDSGDVVVLHTDGITEAEDTRKQQYGIERLCRIIKENRTHSADDIKQAIIDDVVSHIGAQKVFDDITVVVIKKR
jgi:sigma-B regulation protein RsbU (phosphoserine phosphatase)